MITKRVYDDHYCVDILFISGCHFDDFVSYIDKKYSHEIEWDMLGGNHCNGYALIIPRNQRDDLYVLYVERPDDVCTLAHESFHIMGYIFNCKCIEYDAGNSEPWAYYIEWIMREFIRVMKGKK